MFRFDMRNKTPQQQAIVRARDHQNALLAEESKKQKVENSSAQTIYEHAIFMRLGINPSNYSDGNETIKIYNNFCKNHSSVWFSTDSLHGGMALKKVLEFNNAIESGCIVEIYFAIGNIGGGRNDIEYKANVLRVVSEKAKRPTPNRLLTPDEFADDLKYIWIEVNDIQKTSFTTDDFIVISSGNVLTNSIEKSQFHFGYIQKR